VESTGIAVESTGTTVDSNCTVVESTGTAVESILTKVSSYWRTFIQSCCYSTTYEAPLCPPLSLYGDLPFPHSHRTTCENPPTISAQSVSACDLLNTKQDCQPTHRDTNLHPYIHLAAEPFRFLVAVEIVTAPHTNKPQELKFMMAKHVYITLKFKRNVIEMNCMISGF
jgi:hypothetical protein